MEKTLNTDGAELKYTISGGGGPWVTLVNGHTRPRTDFRMMSKYLNSKGFRVLCGDNRGAGSTLTKRSFTLREMVDDLIAIHQLEGIEQSHFVGLSMGGMICQELALTYPRQVQKLVLVSTAPDVTFLRSDESPWPDNLDEIEQRLETYFAQGFVAGNRILIRAMAKQMAQTFQQGSNQGAEWQKAAMADFDARQRLSELQAPLQIIHGDQDEIVPKAAATAIAEAVGHAKKEFFAGAGHLLLAEKPKELYETIGNFLGDGDEPG